MGGQQSILVFKCERIWRWIEVKIQLCLKSPATQHYTSAGLHISNAMVYWCSSYSFRPITMPSALNPAVVPKDHQIPASYKITRQRQDRLLSFSAQT